MKLASKLLTKLVTKLVMMHQPTRDYLMHINPTEEDITHFKKDMAASWSFLKKEGWVGKNGIINPETGKECLWEEAEHRAVSAAIHRDGWFGVVVHTTHSRLKKGKTYEFCFYSHKNHNRLFLFADLIRCYTHNIDPAEVTSRIAEKYAKVPGLKDLTYIEGMWIKVDMWVEDNKAHYKLLEIGDWRERDLPSSKFPAINQIETIHISDSGI